MDILLGFTPYVAFFVIMRIAAVELAMWAAFAMAVLIALYGSWRGRSIKILEIGAVTLFGALAVLTMVAHWQWSVTAVRLVVDIGLLAIVLVSIAIGRPFTMQYARERGARVLAESAVPLHQPPHHLGLGRRLRSAGGRPCDHRLLPRPGLGGCDGDHPGIRLCVEFHRSLSREGAQSSRPRESGMKEYRAWN